MRQLRDPVLIAVLDRVRVLTGAVHERVRTESNRRVRLSPLGIRQILLDCRSQRRCRLIPHPEPVGSGAGRVGDRVQRLGPGRVGVGVAAHRLARRRLIAEDVPVDVLERIAVGRRLCVAERVLRVRSVQRVVLEQIDDRLAGRPQWLRMGTVEVGARSPHRAVDALVVDRDVEGEGALTWSELSFAVGDLVEVDSRLRALVGDSVIHGLRSAGIGALNRHGELASVLVCPVDRTGEKDPRLRVLRLAVGGADVPGARKCLRGQRQATHQHRTDRDQFTRASLHAGAIGGSALTVAQDRQSIDKRTRRVPAPSVGWRRRPHRARFSDNPHLAALRESGRVQRGPADRP
jgi:hypothetical protein